MEVVKTLYCSLLSASVALPNASQSTRLINKQGGAWFMADSRPMGFFMQIPVH